MEKKCIKIGKEMYIVNDGNIFIESEDLASAIQNQNIDLLIDEEVAIIEFADCFPCAPWS